MVTLSHCHLAVCLKQTILAAVYKTVKLSHLDYLKSAVGCTSVAQYCKFKSKERDKSVSRIKPAHLTYFLCCGDDPLGKDVFLARTMVSFCQNLRTDFLWILL